MFNVINLDTGKPLETLDGEVIVYANGREAGDAAKVYTDALGVKHQPRRVVTDVDWRARERKRFEDGTYTAVPWAGEPWATYGSLGASDHFAHVSTEDVGKLAFTETVEKGAADRQTRMRPGKYLKAYFGRYLSEHDIRKWAGKFAQQYEKTEVKFAHTADEIEHVYVNGPTSCMSLKAGSCRSPIHPTRVYAAGDLAIAYLAQDEDGITARVVCWPERKIYSRIYGDEVRLGHALEALGYASGSLRGARLQRVTHEDAYVLPFIDSESTVEDNGEILIIGYGSIECGSTTGLSERGQQCDHCGERYNSDHEGAYIESCEENWCDSCVAHHTTNCEATETIITNAEAVTLADGTVWCQSYFDDHGATYEATGDNYASGDTITLSDGTGWCLRYFAKHGVQCRECGECYDKDDDNRLCCDSPEPPEGVGRDESPDQTELPLAIECHSSNSNSGANTTT